MKRACYFLKDNFIDESQLNGSSVSSEYFPLVALNLIDPYKRSKKWRSAGYFKIPAGSTKIVIKEAGAPITVEITTTEFTSRDAFLDHLEARINAACVYDYVLTIDLATQRTKIEATNIFSILSTDANSGLCDFLGFSRLADLTGADDYLADKAVIHTQEFLTFDLGVDAKPEALVLIGDRAKPLNLSPQAQVFIQANHFNSWDSPAFSEQVPNGQKSVSLVRDDGISTMGFRFWRILIIDTANSDGFVEFNKAYLGDIYSPERGAAQFPFVGDIDDRSQIDESESGERFSQDRRKREKFSLEWNNLTFAEKEAIVEIYEELGKSRPLFMVYDGNGAFSTSPTYYSRFVYFDSTTRYQLSSPGVFQISTNFVEVP